MVKNMPTMQETWVQSLSWEDPLGRESSVLLPGEVPEQRSLVVCSPRSWKESHLTEQLALLL